MNGKSFATGRSHQTSSVSRSELDLITLLGFQESIKTLSVTQHGKLLSRIEKEETSIRRQGQSKKADYIIVVLKPKILLQGITR